MFEIKLVADVQLPREQREIIQDHFADVADRLFELEETDDRLSNADLSVNLNEGRVEVGITVAADSLADASDIGRATIRSAIHGAGGFTPDWEELRWATLETVNQDDLLAL
jgi:hypothetical protein